MPGPKDRDVNKEHGGPAHNLAKHQNDSYALISLIIHQLPTPFWGSNPWPAVGQSSGPPSKARGAYACLWLWQGLQEDGAAGLVALGPVLALVLGVGPAAASRARQHHRSH